MSSTRTKNTFIRPRINLGYGKSTTDGVSSLHELILFNATHNPQHIFGLQARPGHALPCKINFSQLQFAIERASAWLLHSGATTERSLDEQKQPVAILLGSDISIFIYLAALLRIGTPVLILSARLTPIAIAHLLQETMTSVVLISPQFLKTFQETKSILPAGSRILSFDALSYEDFITSPHPLLDALPVPAIYTNFSQHDLNALIMHSSGTTGLPKPIHHAHNFILGYATCHRLPEQDEPYRFNVSTLPLYHGFGLLAPCLSLSIGMPFVLPPATIIPTARSTLALLKSTYAAYMMSVPSILEDICTLPGPGLQTLQSLEIIAIGGAPLKESVGQKLVEAGVNLLNHWGATEIGAIAPIERVPQGYDWHYLMPRDDIGLRIVPADDGATYRIIGHAVGWPQPFVVQDLLEVHPLDKKQFRIKGRADELIVLSNGEKIRPTQLEGAVGEHPDVLAALAFGDRCPALGLLIQHSISVSRDHMLDSILPFLQRGNSATDMHGKVSIDMIVFTTNPLVRTDKGSLARNASVSAFDQDIKKCYARRQLVQPTTPFPSPDIARGLALRDALRRIVSEVTECVEYDDETDFFESRIMDSLQASRVRHAILCSLCATAGNASATILPPDFCFQYPSIRRLYHAVANMMSGSYFPRQDSEAKRISAMRSMVETYRAELASYIPDANFARTLPRPSIVGGSIVLVTGTTGSLGCMIVASLVNDPSVNKVICLNRPESSDPVQRQANAFARRGIHLHPESWKKIAVLEADTSTAQLGLPEAQFNELLTVTHIIHNAWPVNFKRKLSSFSNSVKTLCNLIHLAILARGPSATRLLFASSISVVAQFPLIHPGQPSSVPEMPVEPECTAFLGYAEAKWVCETVLQIASDLFGSSTLAEPLLLTSTVRIGQLSGSEWSGVWNTSEHIPRIFITSKAIGALPKLHGDLSWIPANRAADALVELLLGENFQPFYHLENPSRQSWTSLIEQFAALLGGRSTIDSPLPSIPFPEWLERVKELGGNTVENTAFAVLDFLEKDFSRMAEGDVVLDTRNARQDSLVLRNSGILSMGLLETYLGYWETQIS